MDFTLEGTDAQWVQETVSKATDELRQTAPNGPIFKETVNTVLEREKNWIKWKNELCTPFDREPWGETVGGKIGLEEATKEGRKRMREPLKDWKWDFGTEPLTEIWGMGFRELQDLQNPFQLSQYIHQPERILIISRHPSDLVTSKTLSRRLSWRIHA
jgi:hypothetical protein